MPLLSTRGGGSARGFGFSGGSFPGMIATGGAITEQGDYYLHTFNSTATFAIVKASNTFPTYDWFLMGAGGAGGGGQVHGPAGNGGAAGIKKNANSVTGNVGNNVITIGSGGTKVGNGLNKVFQVMLEILLMLSHKQQLLEMQVKVILSLEEMVVIMLNIAEVVELHQEMVVLVRVLEEVLLTPYKEELGFKQL